MTTKQIDYCIELAHTLNFSRAADNLFVSQPTFSYQIRLLEEEIGFPVFERSGRGAALTCHWQRGGYPMQKRQPYLSDPRIRRVSGFAVSRSGAPPLLPVPAFGIVPDPEDRTRANCAFSRFR